MEWFNNSLKIEESVIKLTGPTYVQEAGRCVGWWPGIATAHLCVSLIDSHECPGLHELFLLPEETPSKAE